MSKSNMELCFQAHLGDAWSRFIEEHANPEDYSTEYEAYGDTYVPTETDLTDEAVNRLWGEFKEQLKEEVNLHNFVIGMLEDSSFAQSISADLKEVL